MNKLILPATAATPSVVLDPGNETFRIEGRSLPEDALEFYGPVLTWFRQYLSATPVSTTLQFKFDYINTTSVTIIQQILSDFAKNANVAVKWRFNEGDEDIEDLGRQFAELHEIPFEVLEG